MKRPNVLFFITDGHRTDMLGCYGNGLIRTPNLDALAADGTRFERAFCPHSVCMPTRASIYTGRYPHVHGVWANGVALSREEITIPQALSEAGYATCAAGKIHFEPQEQYTDHVCPSIDGPYYGFQNVYLSENVLGSDYLAHVDRESPAHGEMARRRGPVPEEAHDLHWITTQAMDFIERQVTAGKPFFCHCSFHELIPPCHMPEGWAGHFDPEDMPVPELRESDLEKRPEWYRQCYEGYLARGRHPDEATLRRHIASCYDQMRFIDKQFGRLVDKLKKLGAWDNTIILFVADHGLSLNDHFQWRHGPFLFDEVINVPMIWRVPGLGEPGAVTQDLVEQVDIMPTVLDLCGVRTPLTVQGASLVPLLRGDGDACGKESVLIQERQAPDLACRGLDPASITQVGIRTAEWKLIRYPGEEFGEMYDLANDPGEFNNLWQDAGYQRTRSGLETLLLDRFYEAGPPPPERHFSW